MTDFMRIRRYIVETIMSGGNMPVTFPPTRRIAEKFGVSQPTALRVVRALMEEGFLKPCRGGGSVSIPLTHIANGTTGEDYLRIFGLLSYQGAMSYDDLYFTYLSSSVSKAVMHRNAIYRTKDIFVETPSMLGKTVRQENLSGLVLLGAEKHIASYAGDLRNTGFPVVSFMRRIDGISSVSDNLEERCRSILLRLFSEGRTHILILCWSDAYYRDPLEAGIASACLEAGIPRGQIIVLDPLDGDCENRVREMLDFGMHVDGVVFYPMHEPVYNLLHERKDLTEECRIVCGSYAVHDSMHFSGYAVEDDFEGGAKRLTDILEREFNHPDQDPVYDVLDCRLVLYRDGKRVGE